MLCTEGFALCASFPWCSIESIWRGLTVDHTSCRLSLQVGSGNYYRTPVVNTHKDNYTMTRAYMTVHVYACINACTNLYLTMYMYIHVKCINFAYTHFYIIFITLSYNYLHASSMYIYMYMHADIIYNVR